MNKKIDLTELLKDCPKGMELDCLMYDNVTLKSVSNANDTDYPICIETKCGFDTRLTKYGQNVNIEDAKCVIFPKGKTTWKGFKKPFVDGDVVMCGDNQFAIFKEHITSIENRDEIIRYYVYYDAEEDYLDTVDGQCCMQRLATEEEKAKLFQVIKDKGYKWNAEEKKLEKLIEPKFKVGDKIKQIKTGNIYKIIKIIPKSPYFYITNYLGSDIMISFNKQDEYELVPVEPKFKVGDIIRSKNGLQTYKITNITSEYYSLRIQENCVGVLPVKEQDEWNIYSK